MYTLKIKWNRVERNESEGTFEDADETTLFIPADEVRVHRFIEPGGRVKAMKSWDENGHAYFNYINVTTVISGETGTSHEDSGRLIQIIRPDGEEQWYLATLAWLLGSNGDTIQRVAP